MPSNQDQEDLQPRDDVRDDTQPERPLNLKGRARYEGLDHSELVHLLDEVDDERARARFRESVYISLLVWLFLLIFLNYGPRYFWHPPHIVQVQPKDEHTGMTYLDLPPDVQRKIARMHPTPNVAERTQESQSPRPAPTPAMPKQGNPGPQAPKPTPQPTQQPAPQPAQQQPQPAQQQHQPVPPSPRPQPTQQPSLPDSPTVSANRPNFDNSQSAGSAIDRAVRNSRNGGGGDYGNYGNGPQKSGGAVGTTILSDTQGVDFSRYLARLLADIKRNWGPLIPEECKPPLLKQGKTGIRFKIYKDGSIHAMSLDYSTHDDAINHSAWGAITSLGQAQPLPPEFKGPELELRIEFLMNINPPGQ